MKRFNRSVGSTKRKRRLRKEMMKRQKQRCAYCGERFGPDRLPTFDHVIPFSRGGNHGKRNLVLACFPCNRKKGATPFRSTPILHDGTEIRRVQ